jgi:hypothetical protein
MNPPEDLPRFPFMPASVRKTRIWEHENRDFQSEGDITDLLKRMDAFPGDDFFLYCPKDEAINAFVGSAVGANAIRIVETQAYYYPHPKSERDYVRIHEGSVHWDWQREVLAKGNMFLRHQLKLSEQARRDFEMQQLIAMQKSTPSKVFKLEPSMWGLGIDLRAAWAWLKRRIGK